MLRNDINVRIGAQDRTQQAFRSAEQRMRLLTNAARTMAGAFGVALGARAFVQLARSALEYADSVSTAAAATQTNAEALQVLRFAAEQSGASVQNLDNALIRANKSAVDAANGMSTAQRAFAQLGINATQFISLPTEQKLAMLARAMHHAEDRNRAAAAVMDIMGTRNAPQLMGMLERLGREGFGALEEAARSAGAVMDEDTIKRLDDAHKAIERFKRAMTIQTGGRLADEIDRWDKFVKMIGGAVEDGLIHEFFFQNFAGQKMLESYERRMLDVARAAREAAEESNRITVSAPGRPDYGGQDRFYLAGREASRYLQKYNAHMRDHNHEAATGIQRAQEFGKAWVEQLQRVELQMKESLGLGGEEMTSFQVRWMAVANDIENATGRMASNMTDMWMDFAQTGKLAFKDFANSVIQDIARIIMHQQVSMPIATGISGALSTGIGAIFGGSRADGGPVAAGRSYLVGERGPEVFTPSSSGHVAESGEAGDTNIYFNITAIDSASFSQHLAQHRREITGIIESAYNRRGRRGPITS